MDQTRHSMTFASLLFFLAAGSIAAEGPSLPQGGPSTTEQAAYCEGECLRLLGFYQQAADSYRRLLSLPGKAFRKQARQRLFDIANYWLDDTREQMMLLKTSRQDFLCLAAWLPNDQVIFRQCLQWWYFCHLDRTKPLLDEEGRAVELLACVQTTDPAGELSAKALFLIGSVRFYREDYQGADKSFSLLLNTNPDSPFAPLAAYLALTSKMQRVIWGQDDGGLLAEARELIPRVLKDYPEKESILERMRVHITLLEAARDFETAERCLRAGMADRARDLYEDIVRRYPGTRRLNWPSSDWQSDMMIGPATPRSLVEMSCVDRQTGPTIGTSPTPTTPREKSEVLFSSKPNLPLRSSVWKVWLERSTIMIPRSSIGRATAS